MGCFYLTKKYTTIAHEIEAMKGIKKSDHVNIVSGPMPFNPSSSRPIMEPNICTNITLYLPIHVVYCLLYARLFYFTISIFLF